MSSTVYPVRGGMEDWAYGAGWDYNDDQSATINFCKPKTYALKNVHMSKEDYQHIRTAMYLLETADKK
jgi:hypothetical protein